MVRRPRTIFLSGHSTSLVLCCQIFEAEMSIVPASQDRREDVVRKSAPGGISRAQYLTLRSRTTLKHIPSEVLEDVTRVAEKQCMPFFN